MNPDLSAASDLRLRQLEAMLVVELSKLTAERGVAVDDNNVLDLLDRGITAVTGALTDVKTELFARLPVHGLVN